MDAFENRKVESFKEIGILNKYIGTVCHAISIINTCKKQNMNIGETLKNIFLGQKKIFAF